MSSSRFSLLIVIYTNVIFYVQNTKALVAVSIFNIHISIQSCFYASHNGKRYFRFLT